MSRHGEKIRRIVQSSGAAASSCIAASWSRSLLLHQLDPDDAPTPADIVDSAECARASERLGRLASIARPIMDRLFAAVGQGGCSVVLTDASGVIVERRANPGDDPAFRQWGLWIGANWSEAREGTNGIGTCLVERRPVTIHRDQHFYATNTAMSCTGAPIFDQDGALAGVLDISSCRADLADVFLALLAEAVADAARRIETENFHQAFASHRVIMAGGGDGGVALLALDQDDLVVGATRRARKVFGLTPESFSNPRPASDVLGAAAPAADLAAAERSEIRRALARAEGNVTRAARDLRLSRATLYRRMGQLGIR